MKGYVQVYTGEGKGKTTSALGLLLRAAGAGLRVYFGQFIKGGGVSELAALRERFPEVKTEPYGLGRFIRGAPSAEDLAAARAGRHRDLLDEPREDLASLGVSGALLVLD